MTMTKRMNNVCQIFAVNQLSVREAEVNPSLVTYIESFLSQQDNTLQLLTYIREHRKFAISLGETLRRAHAITLAHIKKMEL